ncbi:LPD16 domain-containing protein, partial [Enterocloster aldenensis]|uniref:LPD16 domain-containing protein n=1 Tax=Enterocloster aldenensis TaxID=358742 RepID=UPI0032C1A654
GIAVGRGGMACCPFHDDRHPSMKVDTRFHCFGCGADGDVIDFTARLYDLSPKEAAEKLAQDFGLAYDSKAPVRRNHVRQKSEAQKFKEDRDRTFRALADYYHLLGKWEIDYSPKVPEENPHPRFMEAIQRRDYVGYLLDFFLEDSPEEQKLWIAEHQSEIANLEGRVNIMADKPTNRERLQQITAGIEQGIKELFESEKYMRYLSVMSRFHRYSVNNTMLIYMQKPDATLVAGYNKWKNQFERHVKKGEHGITIIAPTPFKKKIEEQKLDPDTKAPILDAEGKAVMEEREVEIPMFRPVKVFDVSQTDGKPLPELASSLSGNVQNYEAFMEALRRSAPVPLSVEPMAANMDGYFSPDQQRIAIRAGMSEVQTVSAAVHEIAHSKLHNYAKVQKEAARASDKEPPKKKDRNTEEVEAESISYAVCQYFGIQTGENSFGYIATWSQDKTLPELRASLETINKAAGELIADIDRHYKEICKERGIDLTAQPEQAMPQQATEEIPATPEPSAEYREALLVLDDTTYLHVQPCDTGWDYTLYDAATRKQLDGGQLDAPELPLSTAALKICEMHGMGGQSIRYAPLSMIETLQEAAVQQMQAAAQAAVPEVTQLPDVLEQTLDEYPMPDPTLTQDDLEKCGYLDSDLLPLSKERAYELMAQDLTVYMVQQGENPAMAFDTADLDAHDGIFAVTREEWEDSPSFDAQVKERMDHQQEREQAFLNHKGDCYAIYQVKHTDELRDIRYEGLEWIKSIGRTVQRDNYDLVYTAPLTPGDLKGSVLDNLEYRFNNEHPADYRHPSMSVSDIVAIKQDGKVSCHYCDSFGFQQIPGFLPDNPLKSAEMTVEDDYGMIDGVINNGPKEPTVAQLEQQARSGQPISLMDLAAAAHREDRDKKKSVVEQLKSQPKPEHKKTAPKKSAEREI